MAETKSRCSSVSLKSTAPEPRGSWLGSQLLVGRRGAARVTAGFGPARFAAAGFTAARVRGVHVGGVDVVDIGGVDVGDVDALHLVADRVDQAADAALGGVQGGGDDDEKDEREGGKEGAYKAGDATEEGQAAVAELATVRVADDDGGDAAGEGDEKAAGAEEDEEDREGAEEEGREGRDVARLVWRRSEAAGCGSAGCYGWGWGRGVGTGVVLGGRGAGRHDGGGGGATSLDAEDGRADLDLVAGADLDRAGDALAVHVGAVGGAEVLNDHGAVVGEDAGVAAGDAGVLDHEVSGRVLAAEDELAVEGELAAGPCACVDDQ